MTDKELLELSAKAVGVTWVDECFEYEDMGRLMLDFGGGTQEWNPLTSDSDAMFLVVKLKLMLSLNESKEARVVWWGKEGRGEWLERWTEGEDAMLCTRRAIVRAAASIGEAA